MKLEIRNKSQSCEIVCALWNKWNNWIDIQNRNQIRHLKHQLQIQKIFWKKKNSEKKKISEKKKFWKKKNFVKKKFQKKIFSKKFLKKFFEKNFFEKIFFF